MTFGGDFYLTFKARDLDTAQLIAAEIVRKFNEGGEAHVSNVLPLVEPPEVDNFTD